MSRANTVTYHTDVRSYVEEILAIHKAYPFNMNTIHSSNLYEHIKDWLDTLPEDSYYIGHFITLKNSKVPLMMRLKNESDYIVFQLKFSKKVV